MKGCGNRGRFLKTNKANVTPVFKKRNYGLVSLTAGGEKVLEQLILEMISRNVKGKKVIGSIHHGFMKGKSCLTKLIGLYNEVTSLVDEQRAMDGVYLDFSKAFDVMDVFHDVLIEKLTKYA